MLSLTHEMLCFNVSFTWRYVNYNQHCPDVISHKTSTCRTIAFIDFCYKFPWGMIHYVKHIKSDKSTVLQFCH